MACIVEHPAEVRIWKGYINRWTKVFLLDVYREEYLSVNILNSSYLPAHDENGPPFKLNRHQNNPRNLHSEPFFFLFKKTHDVLETWQTKP